MVTQEDFERARNDVAYRNRFVDEIELNSTRKYVKKVIYELKNRVISLDGVPAAMQSCPPLRAYFGLSGGKSTIKIFPRAFLPTVHLKLDDFLSTLIDHEAFGHSRLAFEGVDPFLPQEVGVMYEHIERLQKRNCSEQYRDQVLIELRKLLTGARKEC